MATKKTPYKTQLFSRVSAENKILSEATLCAPHYTKTNISRVNKYYDGSNIWVQTKDTECLYCENGEDF